ncbi:MAG: hypothetical protein M1819_003885 [Sarea resinae]|nr:MAG: hypothetical protein M1819_003885 [Sarea resinae]
MRSLEDSKLRWQASFANAATLSELKEAVKDGDGQSPCVIGERSVCWKAFLLFGSLDRSTWSKNLLDTRDAYTSLRAHFLRNIEHPDEFDSALDPLAEDEKSPWMTLRQDEELRAEIFQDVERCVPENSYFRQPSTQTMLLDILFVFCKLNQDLGYRQGMHEILAPVLWAVETDAINPEDFEKARVGGQNDKLMLQTLDPGFVEHDAFTLFTLIMRSAKAFYEAGEQAESYRPVRGSKDSISEEPPIVQRSKRIHEQYLAEADPELAHRLTEIGVLPQVFVIRWVRLLFGREFPFDELLALWDVLFSEDPGLDLVDLICVAMLLRIREQLIAADYTTAFTLLLRYPPLLAPNGPQSLVRDALHLRDNPLSDGAAQVISGYPQGSPARQKKGAKIPSSRGANRAVTNAPASPPRQQAPRFRSPLGSARNHLPQQAGLDAVLHDAAKEIFSRGEKWGINQAVRGVVGDMKRNLQVAPSGLRSPRTSSDKQGIGSSEPSRLSERLNALQARNKNLAKMLEESLEGLWEHQKEISEGESVEKAAAEALSLAVAKVQFVQVYLEDPTIPLLTTEGLTQNETSVSSNTVSEPEEQPSSPLEPAVTANESANTPQKSSSNPGQHPISSEPAAPLQTRSPSQNESPDSDIPIPLVQPEKPTVGESFGPHPFHQSRPSLAQSSFSWMLGEDQRRSEFVSSSPFPVEARKKDGTAGKVGFLFGDAGPEEHSGSPGGGKKGEKKGEALMNEEFKLGTIRGKRDDA